MTDEQGEPKRVLEAEALLARADLREPDWDVFASRVETALGAAGPTDDGLLLPPLPESVEDGRVEATSLADLARAALARRESNDAVSLAKEAFAIAAQQRAAGESPTPNAGKAVVAAEPSIVVERERQTLPPSRKAPPARPAVDTRGPWIGVAVAAVGLAAGFGLYLSGRSRTELVAVPAAVAPASTAAATPSPALPRAAAQNDQGSAAPEVTPEMLPAERSRPAAPAPVAVAAGAAEAAPPKPSGLARSTLPEARAPGAASGGSVHAEKVVLEEDHGAASAPVSQPGTTPGLKPAELNANSGVTDRPSTGAAQAAVGAVLGAARSCLAGQPQGSSATLVFGSNGEVTSVNVRGPAEGTAAAACIQSALKKARVQPFAAPSFSLGVTVRPP